MSGRQLVIAANGRIASRVVAGLSEAGLAPVALVRDEGKANESLRDREGHPTFEKLVVGELTDRRLLESLLADADVAFLALGSSPAQPSLEKAVIDAAAMTRRAHLVKLSAGFPRHDSPVSVLRVHAEIEDHLRASGLPHTLISPATFMDIVFLAAAQIRGTGGWTGTDGRGRNALIDSQDVVDAVVEVILDPAKRGRTYVLTGPEALTWPDVAATLSRTLGREIDYREVSVPERVAQLEAAGIDPWRIELLIGLDEVNRNSIYARPTTDFEALTGKEPRRIEGFVETHRALFEGRT